MKKMKKVPNCVPYDGFYPNIHKDAFISPSSLIIGCVKIEQDANIWYGTVIRGDVNWISIGKKTNIQDLSMVHVETAEFPTFIGEGVTIGHRVVLHGCTICDYSLIGMGAIVMNGAIVGPFSIIGAAALVTPGTRIPPYTLATGLPAKIKRELTEEEVEHLIYSAEHYVELSILHKNIKVSEE